MRVQVPGPAHEEFRGWLLMQVPFGIGLMSGIFLGIRAAPTLLLSVVTTLVCGLVGLGIGIALYNWRGSASAS